MREGVPDACFHLVGAGSKALRLGTILSDAGVVGHSLLFMVGRLRGGSSRPRPPPVPGSWHCYVCDMGGCWPARNTCFRCLAPRVLCLNRNLALSLHVRISFRSDLHSQVEVLTRRTVSLSHRPPRYLPQVVIRMLRLKEMLWRWSSHCVVSGCLRAFWRKCRDKRDAGNAGEKALSDCKAQLHILGQRLAKQRTDLRSVARSSLGWKTKRPSLIFDTGSCLLILSRRLLQRWSLKQVMVPDWKRFSKRFSPVTTWISRRSLLDRSPRQAALPKDRIIFLSPLRLRRCFQTVSCCGGVLA